MSDELKLVKKITYWIIGVALVVSTIALIANKVKEATHINDAVQNYEQYQEIYNSCLKLKTDLCNIKDAPDSDKMFEQFSKAQRTLTIQTSLNRCVEEYNAKSKMWGRSLWKSSALPYQISVDQFQCN